MCVCGMGGEGSVCEKVLYIVCIVYYCNHGKYTAPTYIICKLTMQRWPMPYFTLALGAFLAGATHDSLRELAISKDNTYCFRIKLYSKKFLMPLGLGGFEKVSAEGSADTFGRGSETGGAAGGFGAGADLWGGGGAAKAKVQYKVPAFYAYSAARADRAVRAMYAQGVRLMCFDFDNTIVGYHTGGRWMDTAEQLHRFVRPVVSQVRVMVRVRVFVRPVVRRMGSGRLMV